MLILTHAQSQAIGAACVAASPEEGCGLLLGRQIGDRRYTFAVRPTTNVWDATAAADFAEIAAVDRDRSRRRNFAIDPADLFATQKEARMQGWDILGVFHSHVEAPAQPSEFDRAIAWAEYCYVIVAIVAGQVKDFRAWQLDEMDRFQAESIAVVASTSEYELPPVP